MPKENTHLFFSDSVIGVIENQPIKKIIESNKEYFYLGSVAPDSFFYGKRTDVYQVSDRLHGTKGNSTNEIIFDLLDQAREKKDERELAFAMGFITHCVLDMIFHPIITYFVGSTHHSNEEKRKEANYRHRHWETHLDAKLGHSLDVSRCVSTRAARKVRYHRLLGTKYDVAPKDLMRAFRRQMRINRLLKRKWAYIIAWSAHRLGWIPKEDLAVFYPHVNPKEHIIPDRIRYRDIRTGEERTAILDNLFQQAGRLAQRRIDCAFEYYQGKSNRKACEQIIKGESLEMGREGCSVDEIIYTLEK